MDDSSKSKLKDVLSAIDPVEFKWDDNVSVAGFTAQTMADTIYTSDGDAITLGPIVNSIDMSGMGSVTIGVGGSGNNWVSGPTSFTINTGLAGTQYNTTEIKLGDGKTIDLDELHAIIETVKKRLLILAPNFEMHEKYPMLKELYNEYIALEKLLSGPDTTQEDM